MLFRSPSGTEPPTRIFHFRSLFFHQGTCVVSTQEMEGMRMDDYTRLPEELGVDVRATASLDPLTTELPMRIHVSDCKFELDIPDPPRLYVQKDHSRWIRRGHTVGLSISAEPRSSQAADWPARTLKRQMPSSEGIAHCCCRPGTQRLRWET